MNGTVKALSDMSPGDTGTVYSIQGGANLENRLNALGIIPGKKIKSLSTMLMRGPVTIEVDRAKVAIGFGMARKILIEIEDSQS